MTDVTTDSEVTRIMNLFQIAARANQSSRQYRKICEEFYYDDVAKTKTQFDETQMGEIERTYNIPVSLKFTYAITEQVLSFLTATKPYAKLVAVTDNQQDFVFAYQGAYHATLYESGYVNNLKNVIKDGLTSAEGWFLVRRPNYLAESSTNVIVEYRPWKHILVDPESRKEDYSDARYFFDIDLVRKSTVKERYGVNIPDNDTISTYPSNEFSDLANDFMPTGWENKGSHVQKDDYCWIIDFYEKKEINIYIGNNEFEDIFGVVSTKKPKSISIVNPEKMQLTVELEQLLAKINQVSQMLSQSVGNEIAAGGKVRANEGGLTDYTVNAGVEQASQNINQGLQQELNSMQQQYDELNMKYNELPEMIPAYSMEVERWIDNKKEIVPMVITELLKHKKRMIQKTNIINNERQDSEYLPGEYVPLINLNFSHFNSPNRIFGLTHYMMDIGMAMNKYVADIMYDISVNAHRKGFVPEGSFPEGTQLEKEWAQPNALMKYKPNPMLKNEGLPFILEPSPINQSISYMLEFFKQAIEYITGIYGVVQGNSNDAPNTLGATSSLQAFGTQRVKLYARRLETTLERLAYVVVCYLQKYCPRDVEIKYFDENQDLQEAKIMESAEDLKFKVRVDVTSSLPTQRLQTMQILNFNAQTAGSDELKQLLLEYSLKIADVPEAKEIAEKIDIIKKMQQQMAQMDEALKQSQSDNKNLTNMMAQKDMAMNVKNATQNAEKDIAVARERAMGEVQNNSALDTSELPQTMR